MNSIYKSYFSKVAGIAAGAAMLLGVALPAGAQTVADLQAQLAALSAQLAALQGGGSTGGTVAAYTFSKNLQVGSTGADVLALQKALNASADTKIASTGAGSPGGETTYFGGLTKAAVVKFQNKYASEVLTPSGLTKGTGFVGPATRAKLNAMGGTPPPPCTTNCTTPPPAGAVSVMLDSTSPGQGAVLQGQALADLAHYRFTNNSGSEAVVTSVVLARSGLSSDSTLSNVYLFIGAERKTDAANVSSGTITFNNSSGIFKVPAGGSVIVSVQADIADSTAGQIVGVALVSTVPAVSGTLPLTANYQSVAAAAMGTVALTYTGPTGSTDNPANEVRIFEASTVVSTHKARLEALTIENRGTTKDGDLRNLKLYIDGVQVGSTVNGFVADRATFDLRSTPVILNTGTRIIKVLGDIVGGSSYTYNVQVRRASDVRVIDVDLGQPILATTFPVAPATANTISGGALSITKAAASPSGNISLGATNVKMATFDFRATGEDVKIEAMTVDTDTSISVGGLDNGKVFVNGSQVGSTVDIAEAGTTEFTFGSSFIAKAGAVTVVDIYADAKTSTSTNLLNTETVDVGVSVAAADTEGLNSGNAITANITEVEGTSRTVSASTLTATKASGYGNQTMIAGTPNAKLGSFTLSAGSTEGINVNTIVINLPSNNAASLTDLMLKDNSSGTQIGSTRTPSTDNSFSVNLAVPVSGTKTIDVYGNIKAGSNIGTILATVDATTGGTGAVTANSTTVGTDLDLQTITLGSGTITVAVNNGSTPNSYNAISGSTDVKVGTFRFTTQYSSFTVDELKIKIPTDAATSVSLVTLKWTGGSASAPLAVPLTSSAQTHATSTFTGLGMIIPANASGDLDVYVNLTSIASNASSTGKAVSVLIDANEGFKATDGGGTSDTSAAAADLNSAATTGKGTVYLRKSIPTLSAVALDSTVLSAGSNQVLGRVKIAADSAGDVGWKKISFTVNKTSAITLGATTTVALYEGSNLVGGVFGTTTSAIVGTSVDTLGGQTSGNLTFVATSEQEIAAGTSKTYELRTTVGGIAAGANSVSVSVANPTTSVSTDTATAVAADTVASTPSFGWTDRSSINPVHSESSSDWTNDYLVHSLPLTIGSRSVNF